MMHYFWLVALKHGAPVNFRAHRRELGAWKKAARQVDMSFSKWARMILNAAAVPAPPPVLPVVGGDQVELELPLNGKRTRRSTP